MPATILSLLAIGSTLLLPGASGGHPSNLASRLSMVVVSHHHSTIQSWPIDRPNPWLAREAAAEDEEESSDSDDNVIVGEVPWTLARLVLDGQASTRRLDRGFSVALLRSTIMRC